MSLSERKGELREGYIAAWRKYPDDEVKIRVARPSVLGPSKDLLKAYMDGNLCWEAYEEIFRREISENPKALAKIEEIREMLAAGKNVRLICYEKNPPCHRFILMKLILGKENIYRRSALLKSEESLRK